MALMAAVCLISSGLPRQGQNKQMVLAVGGAGLFLVLSFVLRSGTQRLPVLAPLVYLLPAIAIAICYWFLLRRKSMLPRIAA
jgi:lipopolysaccharide export LptBFGC system permease protein LptF